MQGVGHLQRTFLCQYICQSDVITDYDLCVLMLYFMLICGFSERASKQANRFFDCLCVEEVPFNSLESPFHSALALPCPSSLTIVKKHDGSETTPPSTPPPKTPWSSLDRCVELDGRSLQKKQLHGVQRSTFNPCLEKQTYTPL